MTETYIDEKNLTQKETLETDDFIRVVGDDDNSYKQLLSDVAKVAIEDYDGSVLGGTAQSVQDAIDSASVSLSIADEYDASASYDVGDFCVYENQLYKCTTATTGEWDAGDWSEVTVGDEIETIAETLETKADADGAYDTLIAGNADHLLSDEKITDTAPYLFRRTGGGNTRIGYSCIPTIVGGSVVGNQLANINQTKSGTADGITYSATGNGYVTLNGTAESSVFDTAFGTAGALIKDHVYFTALGNVSTDTSVMIMVGGWTQSFGSNRLTKPAADVASGKAVSIRIVGGYTINGTFPIRIIDLTAKCTAPIADRAYAKEQARAGSGIAWLKSYGFISDSYEEYDTGTMQSVEATAHKTTNENLLLPYVIEQGGFLTSGLNDSTGSADHLKRVRIQSFVELNEGSTYTLSVNASEALQASISFYSSADYSVARSSYLGWSSSPVTFTVPNGARYMRFILKNNEGTAITPSVVNYVALQSGSVATPFVVNTYPLGNVTLRGVPKLDGDSIYYDGDTYTADGTVTRVRGRKVFTGTEQWAWFASSSFWYLGVPNATTVNAHPIASNGIMVRVYATNQIRVYPSDNPTITSETNMNTVFPNGSSVEYRLATPTTETTDPLTTPMLCDPNGTEEWVTSNGVPVGSVTEYNVNLKGKLEALPDLPTADGEYKLKVTVTGGVASYSWEAIV